MGLLIIKIVLIILFIRVIGLTIGHLFIVFHDDTTKRMAKEIMKDPEHYVREDHICKFMYNMIWIVVFIKLLIASFTGHITIN